MKMNNDFPESHLGDSGPAEGANQHRRNSEVVRFETQGPEQDNNASSPNGTRRFCREDGSSQEHASGEMEGIRKFLQPAYEAVAGCWLHINPIMKCHICDGELQELDREKWKCCQCGALHKTEMRYFHEQRNVTRIGR